ncbi:hypothetical protein [Photobacterium damselae]|uniref:hypothetical protein n=1 Tax=Photobacterium damselae TaxID=38293 RepID=UPI0040693FED
MMKVRLLIIMLPLILTGCVENVAERQGTAIDIIPVTYSISVSNNDDKNIDNFLNVHQNAIIKDGIKINWFTFNGKKLAYSISNKLHKKGIPTNSIAINRAEKQDNSQFDMSIIVSSYNTQVERCTYENINTYSSTSLGCFVDGSRWKSMIYPQNMLMNKTDTNLRNE